MELWISVLGSCESQAFVGIGRTEEEAYEIITKARTSGDYDDHPVDDDWVSGPYVPGEAYDGRGQKI